MNHPQKLNILVLGGQSSLGKLFLSELQDENFSIYATCTDRELVGEEFLKYTWFELNLNSQNSIDLFLKSATQMSFNIIVTFIGKTSNLDINASQVFISEYVDVFISRYSNIINQIVKSAYCSSTDQVIFINISSRSAIYGSYDLFYSMAKSSIHALIKSLSRKYSPKIKFFNLVPGLLKNSKMYFSMDSSLRADHEMRAGRDLMSAEEFARYLHEFVMNNSCAPKIEKGLKVDIEVGPQYE